MTSPSAINGGEMSVGYLAQEDVPYVFGDDEYVALWRTGRWTVLERSGKGEAVCGG